MAGSIFKASACSLAVSAMLACLSASAQQQSTRPPDTGKPTTGATQGTPKSAADQSAPTGKQATTKVARADRKFIEEATEGGLAEVELGKLAQQKSQSTMVKEFGSRMVQDHGKANDELKQWASQKSMTLPTELDAKHKATRDKLSKLSGAQFDRAYMQEMLQDHRKDVNDFRKESQSGKDPDVKAWAAKTLPTLEEHLRLAQSTSGAVGTSGSKSGATTGATGKTGDTSSQGSSGRTGTSSGSGTSTGSGRTGSSSGTPGTGSGSSGTNNPR